MRNKDVFFVGLLIIITVLTSYDLIADYLEGTAVMHLLVEALVVITSVFGVGFLLRETRLRRRELETVSAQLRSTRAELSQSREHVRMAGQELMKVIHEQFDQWMLTPSEREVAGLLLKGLSFEEMAKVRNTKEKTVRQQASAIYKKSGLNGRHEFAA